MRKRARESEWDGVRLQSRERRREVRLVVERRVVELSSRNGGKRYVNRVRCYFSSIFKSS
jgi:regulation of enolase protein 1 (concanavalin A-like superfamily)